MFFSRYLNRRAAAKALHLAAGCAAAMGTGITLWHGAPAKADTTPTYLHTFASSTEGATPTSALVLGANGAYYGTATTGGANSEGSIFDVTTSGTLSVLHTFSASTTDGEYPTGGLTLGSDGNFYGATTYGGSTLATTNTTTNPTGEGTIYSMTASGALTLLHSFGDGTVTNDGEYPTGKLVQDSSTGTLYGTTLGGGAYGLGTVYSVTTAGVVTILYSFGASDIDGVFPDSGVVIGADGNLYGTTVGGGTSYSDGTVFQLTTAGVETVLHDFNDGSVTDDGITPAAALIQGIDGNFYGTTFHGGSTVTGQGVNGDGVVYKITPSGTLTILHSFRDGSVSSDGMEPIASLTQDSATGTLYGDTTEGGSTVSTSILYGYGTLFSITPSGTYSLLHSFGTSSSTDPGEFPAAALALNSTDGYLYGSTAFDPTDSAGTLFQNRQNRHRHYVVHHSLRLQRRRPCRPALVQLHLRRAHRVGYGRHQRPQLRRVLRYACAKQQLGARGRARCERRRRPRHLVVEQIHRRDERLDSERHHRHELRQRLRHSRRHQLEARGRRRQYRLKLDSGFPKHFHRRHLPLDHERHHGHQLRRYVGHPRRGLKLAGCRRA